MGTTALLAACAAAGIGICAVNTVTQSFPAPDDNIAISQMEPVRPVPQYATARLELSR